VNSHSPLTRRLLGRIFAFYFSVALAVTAAQMSLQYDEELGKLQNEITAAAQLVEPALSKTMWNIDKPGIAAIAEGLSRNRSVAGLRLEGDQTIILGLTPATPPLPSATRDWKSGPLSKLYEQRFPIRHPESDRPDKTLGTLKIYASSITVIERAMNVLLAIAASAAIKTVALWLILYITLAQMVARPLLRLAGGLDRINREHANELPRMQRRFARGQMDEMTYLLNSFVWMRGALRRSRHKLFAYQSELEQKIAERTRELHHQAMHDDLTSLLNRRAFEHAMTDLMRSPRGAEAPNVLCLIDLDHFKLVNDTFGHAAGDQVLRQVAEILRRNTRPSDTVARMGGDEFAIILHDCVASDAQTKMGRLEKEVASLLLEKDGRRVAIGLSAGLVAFSARTGDDLRHAMEKADAACYAAKEAGRHQVRVFGDGAAALRRKADRDWINVISKALAEDLFLLYAQPIFSSEDAAVQRIEILLRLNLDGNVVAPSMFLPAAERYGLSTRIDEWVLEHTLNYLTADPAFAQRVESVHVNLSASALGNPRFYRFAVRQLRHHRPPVGKICFEVTESAAISRLDDAVRIMNGLRRRGVTFALDDFGHGASSYTYLQTLPVDMVKIDGSFVRKMMDNPVSLAIVKSINDIAHLAGMTTVAEFVESNEVASALGELQIDYLQGFVLAQPVPIERVLDCLRPVQPA